MLQRVVSLCVVLTLMLFVPCRAEAVSTSAASAILMDADSGRVLYQQNADRQMLIASTTKILTALVAIRQGNLADTVKVSREAAYTEGSAMYLKEGETLTLETLLYGLMLCSGNDAAVAIAEHIAGSQEGFARLMNETAKELGMSSSSFANPNGLDHKDHYSTARDMALLACEAMKDPTLSRIVATRTVTIGGRTMTNHNKLLSYMDKCTGLKTGYTKAAGRTLVSCAEQNGQHLIAVTLQDGNDWADHQSLFEYGFTAYPAQQLAILGQPLKEVPVENGLQKAVSLVAAQSFSWPAAADEALTTKILFNAPLRAPIAAGTKVGQAVYALNGQEIGRVDLLCGQSVVPSVESAMLQLKLAK